MFGRMAIVPKPTSKFLKVFFANPDAKPNFGARFDNPGLSSEEKNLKD